MKCLLVFDIFQKQHKFFIKGILALNPHITVKFNMTLIESDFMSVKTKIEMFPVNINFETHH